MSHDHRAALNVLVVEDETVIGMFIQCELEDAGFEVALTGTAADARRMWREGRNFGAAVVDLGLPDEPGERVAADLRAQDPRLPILIATGVTEQMVSPEWKDDQRAHVLLKPYEGAELLRKLMDLIH